MSHAHSTYTEEELNKVLGTSPKDSESGRSEFLAEADKVVEMPANKSATDAPTLEQPAKVVELKTDATSKRLSTKVNKFKKTVADKFPKVVNDAIKDKGPEWALSQDDQEFLAESIENCFEILDIDFKIAPVSATLTNPLWVLILPVLVLVLVFGGKAIKNAKQLREGGEGVELPPGPDAGPKS